MCDLHEIHLHTKLAGRRKLKDGSCLSLLFCFDRCHVCAIQYGCTYRIKAQFIRWFLVQKIHTIFELLFL